MVSPWSRSPTGLIGSLVSCHLFLYHLVALFPHLIGSLCPITPSCTLFLRRSPWALSLFDPQVPVSTTVSPLHSAWHASLGQRHYGSKGEGRKEERQRGIVMDLSPLAFPRASLYSGFSRSTKAKFCVSKNSSSSLLLFHLREFHALSDLHALPLGCSYLNWRRSWVLSISFLFFSCNKFE